MKNWKRYSAKSRPVASKEDKMTVTYDENATLGTRVYRAIEQDILSGRYAVGSSLTELALTADLGVSRTPIRAALVRLEGEGLVRLVPNKGAVVLGISPEDLADIYRMRMRLEGLAAARAAERIGKEDAAHLTETVELAEFYVARGDVAHLRDLDSDFHRSVYLASGSRMLTDTLSDLHRKIAAYRARALAAPTRVHGSVAEHRAILEAILSHDAATADRLASEHAEHALTNILELIG